LKEIQNLKSEIAKISEEIRMESVKMENEKLRKELDEKDRKFQEFSDIKREQFSSPFRDRLKKLILSFSRETSTGEHRGNFATEIGSESP
jgi:regulator of replication initiation timing